MGLFKRKRKPDEETENLKAFLDMIAPSIVKFETGYYICGNTFRCIWALREYPTSTDDLAILRHLGEKHGVTLHIYTRMVSPLEERKIVHNAEIRNRMNRGSAQDMQRAVEAESNLQDVANLIGSLHRNKEPLLHCAVYIEMIAGDMQELQILQTNVEVELMRSKLNVDRLKLRQQAGFCAVSPVGFNVLGTEYERVLPASSVANLFPFNYSGKTDRKGFYIGKDKYGSNIVGSTDKYRHLCISMSRQMIFRTRILLLAISLRMTSMKNTSHLIRSVMKCMRRMEILEIRERQFMLAVDRKFYLF